MVEKARLSPAGISVHHKLFYRVCLFLDKLYYCASVMSEILTDLCFIFFSPGDVSAPRSPGLDAEGICCHTAMQALATSGDLGLGF